MKKSEYAYSQIIAIFSTQRLAAQYPICLN